MSTTPARPVPPALGTVFVTGGSSGLGAAVVAAVTKAGGTPAVIDLVAPDDAGVAHAVADLSDSAAAAAECALVMPRFQCRAKADVVPFGPCEADPSTV